MIYSVDILFHNNLWSAEGILPLRLSGSAGDLLCIELHSVFQLAGDVVMLPLRQVGHNHPRIKGTRVGTHAQLLDGLLF